MHGGVGEPPHRKQMHGRIAVVILLAVETYFNSHNACGPGYFQQERVRNPIFRVPRESPATFHRQ